MIGTVKYIGISRVGLPFGIILINDKDEGYFDSRILKNNVMSDFQVGDIVEFDFINDKIVNITKMTKTAVSKKNIDINSSLNNIANWSIEATEDDEKYFFTTSDFNEIISGSYFYVIGRKGTGKSAIVKNINSQNEKDKFSAKMSFKNFPFNLLYECINSDYVQPNQYISIWKYVIYQQIGIFMLKSDNVEKETKEVLSPLLSPNDEKVKKLLNKVNEFSFGIDILGTGLNFGVAKDNKDIPWIQQLDMLEKLIVNADFKDKYYVLFDELDEDYKEFNNKEERNKYISMLTSLFKAVSYIKHSINCKSNIIPIIFLRTDIYNQITDSDKNKWSEHLLELEWDISKIKSILAYRIHKACNISTSFNNNFEDDFYNIFTQKNVYAGNKKQRVYSVFDYITRSTQWRPRDYIKYITICAKIALKMNSKGISPEIVKMADDKFSEYLKQEIIDEIHPVLPEIDEVLDIFSTIRKQTFSPSQFIQEYNNKVCQGYLSDLGAENVLNILFNYCVIGNQPSMKGQSLFKYVYKDARFNNRENILVHRGLFKSLQIF